MLAHQAKNITDDCVLVASLEFEALFLRPVPDNEPIPWNIPAATYDFAWWIDAGKTSIAAMACLDSTSLYKAMMNHRFRVRSKARAMKEQLNSVGIQGVYLTDMFPDIAPHAAVQGCPGCDFLSNELAKAEFQMDCEHWYYESRRSTLQIEARNAQEWAMAFELLALMGDKESPGAPSISALRSHSVQLTAPGGHRGLEDLHVNDDEPGNAVSTSNRRADKPADQMLGMAKQEAPVQVSTFADMHGRAMQLSAVATTWAVDSNEPQLPKSLQLPDNDENAFLDDSSEDEESEHDSDAGSGRGESDDEDNDGYTDISVSDVGDRL